ncbi:MAG: hypothetical protein ACRCUJ_06130 [Phocaeicola sp.]
MKKMIVTSVMVLALPLVALAQNKEDDLYFIPTKKKTEKVTIQEREVTATQPTTTVYTEAPTTVVVRDASGKQRDIDEYNRRYTSRQNKFSVEEDVLYVEEKPLNERGEWVNGFEGSQDDYEYAMRIVRFRNPRYAIPVSSPLYWDIVYGLPSWNWNVYDDGLYAYAFPTFSNRLWWDWRWSSPSFGFGWNSFYGGGYWGGSYWGSGWGMGWGGGYWGGHWGGHHHHPAWGARPYYRGHGYYGSSAQNPGIHAGRYSSNLRGNSLSSQARSARNSSLRTSPSANARQAGNRTRDIRSSREGTTIRTASDRSTRVAGDRSSTSGRVVTSRQEGNSVRPTTRTVRSNEDGSTQRTVRSSSTYTRPSSTTGVSSSYDRPSSTRTTTRSSGSSSSSTESGRTYRTSSESSSRSSENSRSSSSYNGGSSRSSSSGSSYSGGSSRSSSGGSYSGGASRSGGGSSRGR